MPTDLPQVNNLTITFIVISIVLCAGAPLGLVIWGKHKYRVLFSFVPLFAGVAGFFTAQLFQILLQLLITQLGWVPALQASPLIEAVVMTLMTALTAEFGRFAIFALLKERRDFPDGFAYGIGHGGIEALGTGFMLYTYYSYAANINAGTWNAAIASLQDAVQKESLTAIGLYIASAPPAEFLLYGIDSLCKILIQIALSFIVFMGFVENRKWKYLGIAIAAHVLILFIITILGNLKVNSWVIEGVALLFAATAVVYIIRTARQWDGKEADREDPGGQPGEA